MSGRCLGTNTGQCSSAKSRRSRDGGIEVAFLLWIVAVVLVIGGVVTMIRGAVLYGLLLIAVGLLIGPGGVSIFT